MRWLCVVPFIVLSAPAMAQAVDRDALLGKAQGCAVIADIGQRHACFDGLVPDLKKSGAAASVPQQQAAVQPKPQSALTAPVFAAGEVKAAKELEIEKVSFAVKSITTGSDGRSRFTLENGQVWKQLDSTKLRNLGDEPWTAEIRKAAFGSFLLKIGSSAAVRVERLN